MKSCFHRGMYILFKRNLLLTNSITSGTFMGIGDIIQQEIEYQSQVLPKRYDWARTARMFLVGTAMGPLHHYYYIYLDKVLPNCDFKTVTKKIACDQLFASPATILCFFYGMGILENKSLKQSSEEIQGKFKYVYVTVTKKIACDQLFASPATILCFFYGMGILENKSLKQSSEEIQGKFKYVYVGDCLFWPPVQFLNFYYLPTHYRVFYINIATMIFNIFLSFMKHYDQH